MSEPLRARTRLLLGAGVSLAVGLALVTGHVLDRQRRRARTFEVLRTARDLVATLPRYDHAAPIDRTVLERIREFDALRDGWGRPLGYSLELAVVRVWSRGPNGLDEDGSGDDLVLGDESR